MTYTGTTVQKAQIAMVGTSMDTMGGISSVVKGYLSAGLFAQVPIIYITTHRDGTASQKLMTALKAYGQLIRVLFKGRISVVHVHMSSRASFWRKLPIVGLAKLLRKALFIHLHGSEFMEFYAQECGPVRKRIVSATFNFADELIVLSPSWAQNVRRITRNPNVQVIFNGVSVPEEMPDRTCRNGPVTILFLGRLGRRKGIYELLDALARLKRNGFGFRLVAAGDGEIFEVSTKVRQLDLAPDVDVPGWVDERRKATLLAQADLFVLPSHAEGLPMSLLEAMAAGLPVVCSSAGGMPIAVADGSEGFIVPPGNVDALYEALRRVLSDPSLRNMLGRRAFAKAQGEFDVKVSVDRLVALYQQRIAAPR